MEQFDALEVGQTFVGPVGSVVWRLYKLQIAMDFKSSIIDSKND